MSSRGAQRKPYKLAVAVLMLLIAGYGLPRLRTMANGFRNLFSVSYWMERRAGFDLYSASSRYLKRGRRDRHEVLLTFDDGPHRSSCESILTTLEKEKVPASFFVVGRRVKERPDLVRRMIHDGFEVGNHTEDHLRLDTLTGPQVEREIEDCETVVERACGHRMTLLRPPGMRLPPAVNEQTKALGYTVVGWNVGAKDFIPDQQITDMSAEESARLQTTPDEIVERVMKQVKDGAIILLHDNRFTAAALPRIIHELRSQGYGFRSVTQELAELPHPVTVVANPTCVKVAMGSSKPAH